MNDLGTSHSICAETVPPAETRRLRREAKCAAALATIKAIRPETAKPLPYTAIKGDNPNPTGVVYFVFCAGLVKIGYASDMAARLENIATHCPLPATLLMTITGSIEDERKYHAKFASARANREWFHVNDELRLFLEENFDCGTHELFFEAQFECRDFFARGAAWCSEVFDWTD